jgi:O-antigen ligase
LIKNFKLSLVFSSIIFFIIKLFKYIIFNEESFIELNQDHINKGNFGSQREGFLYLMAIWITFYYQSRRFFLLFKYVIILILLIALLLTFSRASIAGFIISIIFYLVFDFKNYIKNVKRCYTHIFIIICLIFVLYIALNTFHSTIIEFYFLKFVEFWKYLINFSFMIDYNDNTSENFRFLMFIDVIDTQLINIIIGSGYLGVWTISENLIGSAHNQYLDVFFRTGIFGLFIYLFIIYRVVIFLKNSHRSLYFGFIGVLFFGLFHETFKLSQGAFLLTFILGMYENKIRKDKF